MTTVLRASPRRFVSTPSIDRIVSRALRYLQSGYSIHLRGPAGTGKTTLALHIADLLARPIMLLYGDDEFKTSDLIGGQSGYTRKKVVDNFIHSVVKVEDELRQNWIDARLTLACREGFTLVYDEFNRSRPEVNNVLLSALEEKLLVLPPVNNNRSEYLRVNPQFRAIFTSNPEEYCGVHGTQDALMDRLITINMPEPDELTQQEILVQKTNLDRGSAAMIVRLVREFRERTRNERASGLRAGLMTAKICQDHQVTVDPRNDAFRDMCSDILLSRSAVPLPEATTILWELLNELEAQSGVDDAEHLAVTDEPDGVAELRETEAAADPPPAAAPSAEPAAAAAASPASESEPAADPAPTEVAEVPYGVEILTYLQHTGGARLADIEKALDLDRFQTVDALRLLVNGGKVEKRDRRYWAKEDTA